MSAIVHWFKSLESNEERTYISSLSNATDIHFFLRSSWNRHALLELVQAKRLASNAMRKKFETHDDTTKPEEPPTNSISNFNNTNNFVSEFLSKLILIPDERNKEDWMKKEEENNSSNILLSYYDPTNSNSEKFLQLVNSVIRGNNTTNNTQDLFLSDDCLLDTVSSDIRHEKNHWPSWYQPIIVDDSVIHDASQLATFVAARMELSIRKAYYEYNNKRKKDPSTYSPRSTPGSNPTPDDEGNYLEKDELTNFVQPGVKAAFSSSKLRDDDEKNFSIASTTGAGNIKNYRLYFQQPQEEQQQLLYHWYNDNIAVSSSSTSSVSKSVDTTMFVGVCIQVKSFVTLMAARNVSRVKEEVVVNNIIQMIWNQYLSIVRDIIPMRGHCNAILKKDDSMVLTEETESPTRLSPPQQPMANKTTNKSSGARSMASIIEKSIEETIASIEAAATAKIMDSNNAKNSRNRKKKRKKNKGGKNSNSSTISVGKSDTTPKQAPTPAEKHQVSKQIVRSRSPTQKTSSSDCCSSSSSTSTSSSGDVLGTTTARLIKQEIQQVKPTSPKANIKAPKQPHHPPNNTSHVTFQVAAPTSFNGSFELPKDSHQQDYDGDKKESRSIEKPPCSSYLPALTGSQEDKQLEIQQPQSSPSPSAPPAASDSESWEVVERKNRKTTSKVPNSCTSTPAASTNVSKSGHHRRQRSNGASVTNNNTCSTNTMNGGKSTRDRRKSASRQIHRFARDIVSQVVTSASAEVEARRRLQKTTITSSKEQTATARIRRDQELNATIAAARNAIISAANSHPQETAHASNGTKRNVKGKDNSLSVAVTGFKGTDDGNDVSKVLVTATADASADNTASPPNKVILPKQEHSSFMPVPTFLGVNSNNSASSSVSSSLNAPANGVRGCNSGKSSSNSLSDNAAHLIEGYHLLDVCDRLSEEISFFMKRRAAALDLRRVQIQNLMAVMHETVSSIWCGGVRVEGMGSCATSLDLPSSDLDLVVCGITGYNSLEDQILGESFSYYSHPNAPFVMRLAMELEHQPWAVQTKPIPTASVPVVKILVDPSRLLHNSCISSSDAAYGGSAVAKWDTTEAADYGLQQGDNYYTDEMPGTCPPDNVSPSEYSPWRGANLPNGFLSVDITFEGHGHGGIGSTAYAAAVVQEACDEYQVPPEETPIVQLIMVIKELLAQRRLNEPFSGGLSSYSVLLMVCAAIREAAALRDELASAEEQRCDVTSAAGGISPSEFKHSSEAELMMSHNTGLTKSSSWAAIAKHGGDYGAIDKMSPNACDAQTQPKITYGDKAVGKRLSNSKTSEPTVSTEMSATASPTVTLTMWTEDTAILKSNPIDESLALPKIRNSILFQGTGTDDIIEVLCSGEPTSGKLLMYFLLFYGKLFDSQTTVVDMNAPGCPFVSRQAGGSIDPVTGVFTVDPIIVYDPLEGEEGHNVARSCFAWYSIRQVFSQCYATLTQSLEGSRGHVESDDDSHLLALLLSY